MNTITVFNILCAIVFASATITTNESVPSTPITTALPILPKDTTTQEQAGTTTVKEAAEATTMQEPAEATTRNEPSEATTRNEPSEVKTTNEPAEAKTTNEPAEAKTTNEPAEAKTTNEPVEVKTTNEPAETKTTNEPVKTTNEPVKTTYEPVEVTTKQGPAKATTVQKHAKPRTLVEPAEAEIIEESAEAKTTQEPAEARKPDTTAGTMDYYRQEVNKLLRSMREKLTKTEYTTSDLEILRNFEGIYTKIQKAQDIFGKVPSYFSQFYTLPFYVLLDGEIAKVNKLYDNIRIFYDKNIPKMEKSRDVWLALAFSLNDPNIGLAKTIEGIQTYLNAQDESKYIYDLLQKEARLDVCYLKHSPYQILYNMYNIITLAELKAYAMLHFTYVVLTVFNAGNFKQVADAAMLTYTNYTNTHIKGLQNLLSKTDRSVYACDPPLFAENITYTRLTKVLQGYIENERNMHYRGSCIKQCHHFTNTKFKSCSKGFCKHQPTCEGNILRCTLEKPDMTVCLSKDPARRYDWVDYKGGPVMGKKFTCEKENLFKLRSWKRYVVECSYCLCLCDEASSKSDRFFNLRDVTSDVEKNMVVTGVRIIKRNRIIHLQIQQGVLLAGGKINQSTLSWKGVDEYAITDSNVTDGVDYHIINYKSRAINLNELAGPAQHVVTGVRFQKMGSHLSVGIRVTPVNFETGNVSSQLQSFWLRNRKNPPRSAELRLNLPDIPIRFTQHMIYPKPNRYIRFQPTSFQKDLAQTTVPFIDSQEIVTDGVPLSGLGLIYRGKSGSGGFITPKILTYEFGAHLSYD